MKIVQFLESTISGKITLQQQKDYLSKHEYPKPQEIADAVIFLRAQMSETPYMPNSIDICGTGGSGLKRINTSTISAFLVAASGVPIAKHGNNSSSGHFGSFDLLEALDIPIKLSNQELQMRYHNFNLAFLHAKNFHPVMRHFASVRREIKKPTYFNILGPLLSPVNASKQIIGTSNIDNARLLVEVAKKLGKQRIIAVTGSDGLDEVTLCGHTHIVELNAGKIEEYDISPPDFGVEPVDDFLEISANNSKENIKFAKDILRGNDKTRRSDLVLVNSALALYLAGEAKTLKSGYSKVLKILKSGEAYNILEKYRRPSVLTNIAINDKTRNFAKDQAYKIEIIHQPTLYEGGLIAEIKEKSPSEGILRKNVNYLDMAKQYTRAGASAISVLTETDNFGGSFYKFSRARQGTYLPLLCKDFILRNEHIDKAKALGADIILLIVAMLDRRQLHELYSHAKSKNLQILVEVHSENELIRALELQPKLIGVNSRNLNDFSINKDLFSELADKIPKNIIKVAESGIKNFQDIPVGYDGILVGSEIMKHPFLKLKIKELTGKPLLKLCGIRSIKQAELCEKLDVDMIGINFVPRSHRRVSQELAKEISSACDKTLVVGVFENQAIDEVNKIAKEVGLDAMQLSGSEKDLEKYDLPIIKTIKPNQTKPDQAFLTIIDSAIPGSGRKFDHADIAKYQPSLIAGGITSKIAKKLWQTKHPLGFDSASGIETNGEIDPLKIRDFAKTLFA